MSGEAYIEITVQIENEEQGDMILASINESLDVEGVEELPEQLKFYFKKNEFDENLFKKIVEIEDIKYSKSIIDNKNWNTEWESNYNPVTVGDVSIRADFHPKIEGVKYDIVVTPKMSFGTGHHATTSMMVETIRDFSPGGKRVMDFGTGTGVLAILAHKMGAADVTAIDNDDWSIENATENFDKNNCNSIQLKKLDRFPEGVKYDMIFANINLHVINANIQAVAKALAPSGILLVSGILTTDLAEISKISTQNGLILKKQSEKNNWLCITFKKGGSV